MKKRINPFLLRNYLFKDFYAYNNVIKSNNANSLIFFQDNQITTHIPKFLKIFGINVVKNTVIREYNNINYIFEYFSTYNFLKDKSKIFKKLVKLNFMKLPIIHLKLMKFQGIKNKVKKLFITFDRKVKSKKGNIIRSFMKYEVDAKLQINENIYEKV